MSTSDNVRMPRDRRAAVLGYWQAAVGLATGLSVIVGVLISVTQLVEWVDDSKRANLTERLQSLQHVAHLLERDERIRLRARAFQRELLPEIGPHAQELIRLAGSGEDLYLSQDMENFAAVHFHYEQLGALVKLEYIEFPLVYEVVPFPDDYMAAVDPLRKALAEHWKGIGRPLPDLGANIDFLKRCYDLSRAAPHQRPHCPRE
ncbi:hypothetical protein [Roseateles noduli]|uniref:hypothetical protein n=1 Tax=Roseateles noduli TaxID=2052484 RepID=UPI003D6579C2